MKKFVLLAMVVAMFAVAAPVAQADHGNLRSVGVWVCRPKEINMSGTPCQATVPQFPTPGNVVGAVAGEIFKVEPDEDVVPPIEAEKDALGNGGILYSEAINCVLGTATGTLLIGGEPFAFNYTRVGVLAAVTAISDEEIFIGYVIFRPKEDPVVTASRCLPGGNPNVPLIINFDGGGLYIELNPGEDAP